MASPVAKHIGRSLIVGALGYDVARMTDYNQEIKYVPIEQPKTIISEVKSDSSFEKEFLYAILFMITLIILFIAYKTFSGRKSSTSSSSSNICSISSYMVLAEVIIFKAKFRNYMIEV